MRTWQKSLRTAYLTPEVDKGLDARAEAEGVTKGELVREYIEEGLGLAASFTPRFEGEDPIFTPPAPPSKKIMRSFYLTSLQEGTLSSRASGERVNSSQLIDRFCAEGLARPPSGGAIALKAKRLLVAEHKAKIEDFTRDALEARNTLDAAVAEFLKVCPHVDLPDTLPLAICRDCGATVARSK